MQYIVLSLVYALSIMITTKVVPSIRVRSYGGAVVFALVLGVVDSIGVAILGFLSLPLIVLTLGLWFVVLHTLMFWLVSRLVPSVYVPSFGSAFLGTVVSGLINMLLTGLLFQESTFFISC